MFLQVGGLCLGGRSEPSAASHPVFYSIKKILEKISIPDNVADYGGANGILKDHIPGIISIDIDPSKNPDIEADILKYKGDHDLIIIRFVLHYLNDYEIIKLFDHINSYHKGEILIIQFCNNDLRSKYYNSRNEFKYFRTEDQMENLLPGGFKKIFTRKCDHDNNSMFWSGRHWADIPKN